MKPREGYVLRDIRGSHHLLPIGQNIALHKNGVQLNNTGVLLWNAISNDANKEDLLPLLVKHFKAESDDIPALQLDINAFILQLSSMGLLINEDKPSVCNKYFKIGNIIVGYYGPDVLLHSTLLDFSCNADLIEQHWIIEPPPTYALMGEILIRTKEIEVCRNNEFYIINFLQASKLIKAHITLDGSYAHFYCIPSYDNVLINELFHAFRFAFLIYAQKKGLFAVHSSSILYNNKAWLFSASSGTGKSTHAKLWYNLYQTPILNGDLNLISIENCEPILWGLPWCGTSQIYTAKSYPLGGITMLKQHPENKLLVLSKSDQHLMLMQRLISPSWTAEMLDYNLNFSGNLVECISVYRLLCTKDPAAIMIMKQLFDKT